VAGEAHNEARPPASPSLVTSYREQNELREWLISWCKACPLSKPILRRFGCREGVWVGWGVSEVLAAFVTSLASVLCAARSVAGAEQALVNNRLMSNW
jgi:hypothetical protein